MRFPILEDIQAGRCFIYNTATDRRAVPLPGIEEFQLVRSDDVARWYWEAEVDGFELTSGKDFGIIKPPFPFMYFEWESPARVYADREWTDNKPIERPAAMLAFDLNPGSGQGRVVIRCLVRDPVRRHESQMLPFFVVVDYDEHGMYTNDIHDEAYMEMMRQQGGEHEGDDTGCKIMAHGVFGTNLVKDEPVAVMKSLAAIYKPGLLAISFMHCKGTRLEQVNVPAKVQAKRARGGAPGPAFYNVIRLPTLNARTARRSERKEALGEQMSAHWVRGHFKTYTTDAPLFGKRTGSYWWQPNVRGVGEANRKTYEVSPPEDVMA